MGSSNNFEKSDKDNDGTLNRKKFQYTLAGLLTFIFVVAATIRGCIEIDEQMKVAEAREKLDAMKEAFKDGTKPNFFSFYRNAREFQAIDLRPSVRLELEGELREFLRPHVVSQWRIMLGSNQENVHLNALDLERMLDSTHAKIGDYISREEIVAFGREQVLPLWRGMEQMNFKSGPSVKDTFRRFFSAAAEKMSGANLSLQDIGVDPANAKKTFLPYTQILWKEILQFPSSPSSASGEATQLLKPLSELGKVSRFSGIPRSEFVPDVEYFPVVRKIILSWLDAELRLSASTLHAEAETLERILDDCGITCDEIGLTKDDIVPIFEKKKIPQDKRNNFLEGFKNLRARQNNRKAKSHPSSIRSGEPENKTHTSAADQRFGVASAVRDFPKDARFSVPETVRTMPEEDVISLPLDAVRHCANSIFTAQGTISIPEESIFIETGNRPLVVPRAMIAQLGYWTAREKMEFIASSNQMDEWRIVPAAEKSNIWFLIIAGVKVCALVADASSGSTGALFVKGIHAIATVADAATVVKKALR